MGDISRRHGCEGKGTTVAVHAMKAYVGLEMEIHALLTSSLVEGDASPHMPAA
jgi:hypothetical protein